MSRVRFGDVLAGVAGLALIVDLFLPWYREAGSDQSAFQSLSVILALLLVTGLLGLAVLVLTVFQPSQAQPVAAETWAFFLSVPTLLLVLYRILNAPGDDAVVDVRWGAWIGLLLTLSVLVGSITAFRAESR